MKTILENISKKIYDIICPHLIKENISDIKNIRGDSNSAPRACKKGSSVYILYSQEDEILYVGETGKSVKKTLFWRWEWSS